MFQHETADAHGEHIEHRETMGEHLRRVKNMDYWSKVLSEYNAQFL